MAKPEHPEKYAWWLNELESLGISTSDLTDAMKKTRYEEYLQASSEK
ncbi:MAG TPA: hypothetical protein VKA95_02920 [Nitrososphaeraceae archaeon]|nr:hypothetical protein [Nitrososphaeraceae archaeon]